MGRTWRDVRSADFQRRVASCRQGGDGMGVYRHRTRGWEYLPVHPFGDEPEVLERLGLRPEDCRTADAWWGIDDDATLIETGIVGVLPGTPRLFAKPTPYEEQWVYLVAVLDAPFVTRVAFEHAMVRFAEAGFPRSPAFRLRPGDPPIQITEQDTCGGSR